jgi:hypothetical protein
MRRRTSESTRNETPLHVRIECDVTSRGLTTIVVIAALLALGPVAALALQLIGGN